MQRLHSKIKTQAELQQRAAYGSKTEAAQEAKKQTRCLACDSRKLEDAWHFLGTCRCTQLCGHRKSLFHKYDATIQNKRKKPDLPARLLSDALRGVLRIQNGYFSSAKRGFRIQRLQNLLQGMVPKEFVDALGAVGVSEEATPEVLRWHGAIMKDVYWEGWRIRQKVWNEKAT